MQIEFALHLFFVALGCLNDSPADKMLTQKYEARNP